MNLATLTAWFAWATETPDTALDPMMVLALSVLIVLVLLALLIVVLWPMDEPHTGDDPYSRAFGDWPSVPKGSVHDHAREERP